VTTTMHSLKVVGFAPPPRSGVVRLEFSNPETLRPWLRIVGSEQIAPRCLMIVNKPEASVLRFSFLNAHNYCGSQ
jgi:hypothetical protein